MSSYTDTPYYRTGRASDLSGSDRVLYRALEILPGALAWGTIILTVLLSYFRPTYAAFFIIAFNLYWVLKSAYFSLHLRQNWKRLRHNMALDWPKMLEKTKYEHIIHVVILPFYREPAEVIQKSIESLYAAAYDKKKIAVVLAVEASGGSEAAVTAAKMRHRYENRFGYFLVTNHPAGIPGEMPGKGSNIAYAAQIAKKEILEKNTIPIGNVIVSAFDIDTVIYPNYFSCLTWYFMTVPDPYHHSFQPVPLYNNNMWQSPFFSRVVATSGTFWQMIQQERPERLTTFSSHAISFKALDEIGYWQKNIVSEDSRIFWNAFFAYDGKYHVEPISFPVSMDANLAPTLRGTILNVYKQQRRWCWGVENIPYLLMGFIKNTSLPLRKKLKIAFVELERTWSLATNPLLLFLLSWLPLIVGGRNFNRTILSYNLPVVTRYLTFLGILGLIFTAIVSLSFLPEPPKKYRRYRKIWMFLQWMLLPVTIIFFGSIPALDAQTRLMLGRYMGFWVTPKEKKA